MTTGSDDCTCSRTCECEFENNELVGINDYCPEHGDDTTFAHKPACTAQIHWWSELDHKMQTQEKAGQ